MRRIRPWRHSLTKTACGFSSKALSSRAYRGKPLFLWRCRIEKASAPAPGDSGPQPIVRRGGSVPVTPTFRTAQFVPSRPLTGHGRRGGDLRTLLDLYTVWAARQLFLEVFGLWPGKQYALIGSPLALQVHYRLSECRDDELCGCGSETLRYADCCKPGDLKWNRLQLIEHFMQAVPGGFASRKPPAQVLDFIDGRTSPPLIAEVHMLVPAS